MHGGWQLFVHPPLATSMTLDSNHNQQLLLGIDIKPCTHTAPIHTEQ